MGEHEQSVEENLVTALCFHKAFARSLINNLIVLKKSSREYKK